MDLFKKYLKYKKNIVIFYLMATDIMLLSFFLYRLPMRAAGYPLILITVCGIIALILDFRKASNMHRDYERAKKYFFELSEDMPASTSINEEDLKEILTNLSDYSTLKENEAKEKFDNLVEYYNVWCHQIKTPIAAMRLSAQNEDSSLARKITGNLDRIDRYVDMVLAYLRLDSTSSDYVFKEYDLDSIIKPCIRKFSREFIDRKLSLRYEPVNIKVLTDEKWLSFVIEQVLSNALKYTREGSISIYVSQGKILCIEDTGIGIEASDLPRIFEKGYTGYNGRIDKKASGIGLYLCKRTCKALGHDIYAKSTVGKGTTIFIDMTSAKLDINL